MIAEMLSRPVSPTKQVVIVPRADIPAIHTIEQQGKIHQLGELRDFQWHEALKEFMPSSNEFSISWVCLQSGETLLEHTHPIQSMMIFYQGSGKMLGQNPQTVQAGDVVVVPPGCSHGFVGGEIGLYALSIQFGPGLYTNPQNPLVQFNEDQTQIKALYQYHLHRLQKALTQPFFQLFNGSSLNNPDKFQKLLNCMSVWDSHLNTPLCLRHDSYQNILEDFFDPVLEALVDWFPYQMQVLDQAEKYLLRHWIIADLRDQYHTMTRSHIKAEIYDQYFTQHFQIDQNYDVLNATVLQHLRPSVYHRLKQILILSWNHVEALLDRMYEIIEIDSGSIPCTTQKK